jgi:hypothetical protein
MKFEKYLNKKNTYKIIIKRNLIKVERKLTIKDGMFDEQIFNMDEEEMFDFEFANNFLIGNDVILDPIEQFGGRIFENNIIVIRFIHNEEIRQ